MNHFPQQLYRRVIAAVAVVVLCDPLKRLEIQNGRSANEELELFPSAWHNAHAAIESTSNSAGMSDGR